MSEYKLTEEIIKLSVADRWDQAKLEWTLQDVYFGEEPSTCLCGHTPIIEICTLKNIKNANIAEVGNCCVKKFIGLPSDKIFQAIKRIKNDAERALNAEAVDYFHSKGILDIWEYNFYFDTLRKRNLSDKQLIARVKINKKVLLRIASQRLR